MFDGGVRNGNGDGDGDEDVKVTAAMEVGATYLLPSYRLSGKFMIDKNSPSSHLTMVC